MKVLNLMGTENQARMDGNDTQDSQESLDYLGLENPDHRRKHDTQDGRTERLNICSFIRVDNVQP
jgi:hypothetical protein